ncbi:MAG: hypothetical protein JNL74_19785, partial [Fibrobacteres bacterium]|nr:hypothetical protein [Fibrobacterota bacterium]
MKTISKAIIFTVISVSILFSQQLISSRHEFIGYNIGNSNPFYPQVNEVPDGQSGVTALAVGQDGNVYGGTSATNGKSCYLITYKTKSNLVAEFYELDKTIKGQPKIGRALVSGQDGFIYGGTSIYSDTLFVFADSTRNKSYVGGHLFRFKEGKLSSVEDLGVVLPAEGIRVLASDPKRERLYGLTEPGYRFFIYDIKTKKLTVRQDVDLTMEKENCYNQILLVRKGLALAIDKKGCVWGSAYKNKLFRYNPEGDKLEVTSFVMPASYGHTDRDGLGALIASPDGLLYGGTQADGVLFR